MEYANNPKWLRKRISILNRDRYQCQECNRYGRCTQANTVHHIVPVEVNPDYQYLSRNLISVCNRCHNEFHDRITNALTEKGLNLMKRNIEEIEKAFELNKFTTIPPTSKT